MHQPTRRAVLAGLATAGLLAGPAHAVPAPRRLVLGCRMPVGGGAVFSAVDAITGRIAWEVDLPGRGHDVVAGPDRRFAMVPERRPGTYVAIIDIRAGRLHAILESPAGRHVYGHGAFSADGRLAFVTENRIDDCAGRIAVLDATDGFRRVGDLPAGGVGPHQAILGSDGRTLVVANGGLMTRPETGRTRLNLDTMRPNVALVDIRTGDVLARLEPPADLHQLSLRHVAPCGAGGIAVGAQYEGAADRAVPLVGRIDGKGLRLFPMPESVAPELRNYTGAVACDPAGRVIVATCPRGNAATVWDSATGALLASLPVTDVCGAATVPEGVLVSGYQGLFDLPSGSGHAGPGRWDNHLAVVDI